MQTTSDVVKAFVNLTAQSHSGLANDEMKKRCQEAETEVRNVRPWVTLSYLNAIAAFCSPVRAIFDQNTTPGREGSK